MPVYKVQQEGQPLRLVKAGAKTTAINHVIRNTITAEPLSPDELADLYAAGHKVETAAEAPAATQQEAPVTRSEDVKAMDPKSEAA